ncbi:MAG: hypothetical protein QF632_01550 [Candidatus Woesearchaeota archaeon]|jgi:hypothetical protein|nr:hypothetical protein [Candidatus Woesearchaeota archaeon]
MTSNKLYYTLLVTLLLIVGLAVVAQAQQGHPANPIDFSQPIEKLTTSSTVLNEKALEVTSTNTLKIFMVPWLGEGGWNPISSSGDKGIFWTTPDASYGGDGSTGALVLGAWGNSPGIKITKDGKVGIGTTNPGAVLHVAGTGNIRDTCTPSNSWETDVSAIRFKDDPNGGCGDNAYISYGPNGGTERTVLKIVNQNDNAPDFQDDIAIMPAGNVGIGTTSPDAKLDVEGTVRLGRGIADSWFPYIDNNAYVSGNQIIFRSDAAGSHTEVMRIDTTTGKVGIGRTSIESTLDIEGNLFVRTPAGTDNRFLNPVTGGWTHIPWTDGNIYLRAPNVLIDHGSLSVSGTITVAGHCFKPRTLTRCYKSPDHMTWVDNAAECNQHGFAVEDSMVILAAC